MVLAAGCTGDLTDLGPAGKGSGGSGGAPSGGGGSAGGGTGGAGGAAPMNVTFTQIQADFDAKICSSAGCHGGTATGMGGAVYYLKAMATGADLATNYTNTKNEINTGAGNEANSLILTKNLPVAAGGVTHLGGNGTFASTTDATYLKWLNWIKAGAPQQ